MTDHAAGPVDPRAWAPPSGPAHTGPEQEGAEARLSAPVPRRRIDPLAIASLVTALLGLGPAAVVLGHVALVRTKRSAERGRGLALAGLVLGYLGIVLAVVGVVVYRSLLESLRSGGYLPA